MNIEKQTKGFLKSTYRWIVLFSFSLNSVANVFIFTAITPIWSSVAIYYGTTDYKLNWFTNCFYLGPMTVAFLLNPLIIRNFGVSQIISSAASTLGLWLLIFGSNYYLGLLGFALLGVGEALFFQVPLCNQIEYRDLSKLWFSSEERILSTFIGQYANNLGMLLGYTVSSLYLNGIFDQYEIIQRYKNMLTINAILSTLATLLNFFLLKDPYNKTNQAELRDTLWTSIYKIITTQESILDFLSLSSFIGLSWCYTMLFSAQQYGIGQTYLDVAYVTIAFQVGQILAAMICTYKLDKQSKQGQQQDYDKFIQYTTNIGFGCLVIEILFFEQVPIILLIILNIFIGGGLGGLYAVLLESLMEKHFPVQELVIGGIFAAVTCGTSFFITMILVIPQFLLYGFQISCYFMIPSYCYMTVFYKTSFKRFELDG